MKKILYFILITAIPTFLAAQATVEPNSILMGADQINMVDGDTIFYWNQARNALRVGPFTATQISNANVGTHSVALGSRNEAKGITAVSMGGSNKAQGAGSIALGTGNIADRDNAISLGYQNKANAQESVAIGNNNDISYARGAGLGNHLIVNNEHTVAVGTFNEGLPFSQNWLLRPIFVVGNGDGRDIGRRNAMTVIFDGRTGFNTSSPQSDVHVNHKNFSAHSGLRIENEVNGWWRFYTRSQTNELALFNDAFMSGTSAVGEFNTSGSYSGPSDRRLKKNIVDLPYGLKDVLKLSPKQYQFKHVEDRLDIGLIAQEVIEVIPELVSHDEEADKYMLNYDGFGVLSIKAIQEVYELVEEQEQVINNQSSLIAELFERVARLEKKE